MKREKNKAVNSDAYAYLKSLLHPNLKIVDISVEGKYLKAQLHCPSRYDAGIQFSVKNQSFD
ncbi:MAG: hypothetical protein AABY22_12605 [Nanoarchaeota archaeon]